MICVPDKRDKLAISQPLLMATALRPKLYWINKKIAEIEAKPAPDALDNQQLEQLKLAQKYAEALASRNEEILNDPQYCEAYEAID